MNKDPMIVRKVLVEPHTEGTDDRRVRKTRMALTQALFDLAMERRWASIRIHDILERANVGRSTFYSHYRSKDDLLFRSFESMLRALDQSISDENRLAPVGELCEHIRSAAAFHQSLVRAKMTHRLFQQGIEVLTQSIADRLRRANSVEAQALPVEFRACALSGALFAMIEFWLARGMRESAAEIDHMFHHLVSEGR